MYAVSVFMDGFGPNVQILRLYFVNIMRISFYFCLAAVLASTFNPQGLSFGSLAARAEPDWMSKVNR